MNRVVPLSELNDEAVALARRIAQFDATTLEWSKKALWQIPMNISNYTSAMEYGFAVNAEIRSKNGIDKVALPESVAKTKS